MLTQYLITHPSITIMSIVIKPVTTTKELKQFIRFANDLYTNNPYYCPAIELDEINTFNPRKNPAFEVCESSQFVAYQDGTIVGRIAAIINHNANQHWNNKKARFGWFDFIDDLAVSKALIEQVAVWAKEKGMESLNGPVGFTDLDHQGLLIEGFEYLSPMASLYNFPYYQKHYEALGFEKEADWIEYRVFIDKQLPERFTRVSELVLSRSKVRIVKYKSRSKLLKDYGMPFFRMMQESYHNLYNYAPLTERQMSYYANMYIPLLNPDFVTLLVNEQDELVGIGAGMPNITPELQRCKGKLFPFGWIGILKALRSNQINAFDLLLIAIRPDYQGKGINALLFYDQFPKMSQYGVNYCETTSILETNEKNQANWESFNHILHKRRRAYIKPL